MKSFPKLCASLAILAVLLASSVVHAQQTTPTKLNAPSIQYGTGTWLSPTPTQVIGYDSSTSLPCIIGYSATCQLSVSVTGGSGSTVTANQGTPNTGANAWPVIPGTSANFAKETGGNLASILAALGSPFQASGALGAGQAGIGNVGGKTVSVCNILTVTASNSYGINYIVGGLQTFSNAFTSTGSGILQAVTVTIKDQETSGFVFVPFVSNPSNTTWTDAAVAAINAADVPKVRGPVPLALNIQLASTLFSLQYAYGIGLPIATGGTSLYGVLLANAALTNQFAGTGDVQVCVTLLDDE